MKILVAEKNEVVRNAISYILSNEQYDIELVKNGKEAYEALENNRFDLLITNLFLKYFSGFELISYLKKENIPTKIMVISESFTADNMYRLYEMGIDEMIEKPFIPMELICRTKKLAEIIEKKISF